MCWGGVGIQPKATAGCRVEGDKGKVAKSKTKVVQFYCHINAWHSKAWAQAERVTRAPARA